MSRPPSPAHPLPPAHLLAPGGAPVVPPEELR